jgi:hypothetical protein
MPWKPFDPAEYPVGATVYVAGGGWGVRRVSRYTVKRVTPSGMVIASRKIREDYEDEIRINNRGSIIGEGRGYHGRTVINETDAKELRKESLRHDAWNAVRDRADDVAKAARNKDEGALAKAFEGLIQARDALAAQGIDAATAGETGSEADGLDPKDESPVGNADAPTPRSQSTHSTEELK